MYFFLDRSLYRFSGGKPGREEAESRHLLPSVLRDLSPGSEWEQQAGAVLHCKSSHEWHRAEGGGVRRPHIERRGAVHTQQSILILTVNENVAYTSKLLKFWDGRPLLAVVAPCAGPGKPCWSWINSVTLLQNHTAGLC